MLEEIRELARRHPAGSQTRQFCEAILHRTPPKMVGRIEAIGPRDDGTKRQFDRKKQAVEAAVPGWVDRFGIPVGCWHVWHKTQSMTKFTASAAGGRGSGAAASEKALRILGAAGGLATPIMEDNRSLMSTLAERTLYTLRVYVLLPAEAVPRRNDIEMAVQSDRELGWV